MVGLSFSTQPLSTLPCFVFESRWRASLVRIASRRLETLTMEKFPYAAPVRMNELTVAARLPSDDHITFIGSVRTPWSKTIKPPRMGERSGPLCTLEILQHWRLALEGIEQYALLEVLYWMHLSRRDLLLQSPADDGLTRGTFSIRSPIRPNPIATSIVRLEYRTEDCLFVRGMDCYDKTPLLDIKPYRGLCRPLR